MAFSATQREQIRQYLGYDAQSLDADLEQRIDNVEGLGAAAEATVAGLLTQIAAVEAGLTTSGSSATRGTLKRADDIEFYPVGETTSVGTRLTPLQWGRLLIARLAARLELDPDSLPTDYFGSDPSYSIRISSKEPRCW